MFIFRDTYKESSSKLQSHVLDVLPQVKRCAEMSRKLRFCKDQIQKAGLTSSVHPAAEPDIDLEELEVYF